MADSPPGPDVPGAIPALWDIDREAGDYREEMSRFLVTGSNSFSGGDLIDLLLDDPQNEVVGISRSPEKSGLFAPYRRHILMGDRHKRFRFQQINLNSDFDFQVGLMGILRDFQPEYVINFAAQSEVAPSWDSPADWYQTNVIALCRLTEEIRKRKTLRRWLQISTPEVYGSCKSAVKERQVHAPSTPYAASKSAADTHLALLLKHYGFPVVTVRSANVYGPGQQLWKIIPRTIIRLKLGQQIQLHGGGEALRSFIHIRDVSRGEHLALMAGSPGDIYHLTSKRQFTIRGVVRLICNLMGADYEHVTERVPARPGSDAAYRLNGIRARRALGWEPRVDLVEGVQSVIAWVEANWEEIQRQPMEYAHQP